MAASPGWTPLRAAPGAVDGSPYAVELVAAQGTFGAWPYDDPASALGTPATRFYDPLGAWSGGTAVRRVKLVEAAHHLDPTETQRLIATVSEASVLVARFGQPVQDDPAHPYGIDLLVFGNGFLMPSGFVDDGTDMNTLQLAGGGFFEQVQVSVSPGYTGGIDQSETDWQTWDWHRYDRGPYADSLFPTQAYRWDRAGARWTDELMDFTKPVNPVLADWFGADAATGLSAADAIDLYVGSGGGTGFDLAGSGFSAIQYIKVEGLAGFSGGEIDAFSAVRCMVLGDALSVAPANLAVGLGMLRFQRPDAPAQAAIALDFTAVNEVARVSTWNLTDPFALAPLPGRVLTAAGIAVAPLLGGKEITFQVTLRVASGPDYQGDGSDLDVFRRDGAAWARVSFNFEASTRSVAVPGLTHLSEFALVQIHPPRLALARAGDGIVVQWTPLPGWRHTLERTSDLQEWTAVTSIVPPDGLPVALSDPEPPAAGACYRLRLDRP